MNIAWEHYNAYGDRNTSVALFAEIVPDDLKPAVMKHLEEDMTGAHPYFDIGSFSRYRYFNVLLAHQHLSIHKPKSILDTKKSILIILFQKTTFQLDEPFISTKRIYLVCHYI